MKSGLLVIPFIAILVGALSTALGSAFPDKPVLLYSGWSIAAALVALWIILDFDNVKGFFTRKGARYGASSGLVLVLAVLVIVGVATLTSRPRFNKSYDATRAKVNTLSEQSLKVVDSLAKRGEDVKAIAFFQDEKSELEFRDLMGLYLKSQAKIAVEYADPRSNPTRALAEKITQGNTVVFRLGKQEARVTTFTEEKVTNALIKVLKDKPKKVYFTQGHGEGEPKGESETGFGVAAQELENNQYVVEPLALLETARVPDDADLVIVGGPKYDLKPEEIGFLEAYLARGGALLSLLDSMVPMPRFNALLETYGVKLNSDLLILRPDDPRAQLVGQNNAIVSEFDNFNPVTKDFARQSSVALLLSNARSLDEVKDNKHQMKVTLAAKTASAIIRVKDVATKADLKNIGTDRIEPGPFAVIAVAVGKSSSTPEGATSPKETRMIVVGSSVWASNAGAQAAEHRDMFTNMANYLLQDEDFISIRPKDLTKSTIKLTSAGSQFALLFLVFIYPFLFLGGCVAFWLARRKA